MHEYVMHWCRQHHQMSRQIAFECELMLSLATDLSLSSYSLTIVGKEMYHVVLRLLAVVALGGTSGIW